MSKKGVEGHYLYFKTYFEKSSVLQSPVFTKQPGSIVYPVETLEKNREVVFSCEAQGSPPPIYRWKLNGTEINPKSGSHYSLSGGNLRIGHLNKDQDAGTYQCLASNSFGTIVSREASLTFAYRCVSNVPKADNVSRMIKYVQY
ncbi:Contactin-3 Brain-derived immunoglobulin superfamily protein 1 [Collichthys lucidus]|nr:Contactin-3 Brain-derived immunoglobulin superfamily protein 1 [Collichthys lucidus]